MRLEHQPAQPEQRATAVAAVVEPVLELLQHRPRRQRRQFGEDVAAELFAHDADEHRGGAFGRLEGHVADEAVAHDDVGRAFEDVVAFHVAVKVEVAAVGGLAQQFAGLLDDLAALDLFFADVEQPDRRVRLAGHRRNQRAAHHRELQQVVRSAIDVRAQVEHGGVAAALVRHDGGDGRPVDALERLEHIARHRHQRAGVACRHAGLRSGCAVGAGLDLAHRNAQRRVTLAAQRHFDRVVHLDDFGGRHDGAARPVARQRQRLGAADENQFRLRVRRQEGAAGRQRGRWAVVAAHAIDSYAYGAYGAHDGHDAHRRGFSRSGHGAAAPIETPGVARQRNPGGLAKQAMCTGRSRKRRERQRATTLQASALVFSTLRPR